MKNLIPLLSSALFNRHVRLAAAGLIAGSLLSGVSSGAEVDRSPVALTSQTFASKRVTLHYWEAGPSQGPLMIFVHGWPEIGLVWRAQMETFASQGWHCVAPDLRGFGDSSVPKTKEAYALKEVAEDLIELQAHVGGKPAIWVGHDWGSPTVALLVAHHPELSRGVVLLSVPYLPNGWAMPNLIPFIDRKLYPAEKYPDGQWDYWRFYLTHFDQAVSDMDADVPATLASIYRKGEPGAIAKPSPSADVTAQGGRFGAKHRAPSMDPDPDLWPRDDFKKLVAAFKKTGFRPANSFYLNDEANIAYAKAAENGGKINQPVLFINNEYEPFSNINLSKVGDPMRAACSNLTTIDLPSGHWVTLERKAEVSATIRMWLKLNDLQSPKVD